LEGIAGVRLSDGDEFTAHMEDEYEVILVKNK